MTIFSILLQNDLETLREWLQQSPHLRDNLDIIGENVQIYFFNRYSPIMESHTLQFMYKRQEQIIIMNNITRGPLGGKHLIKERTTVLQPSFKRLILLWYTLVTLAVAYCPQPQY